MIKNYTTPLNIEIINKGDIKDSFVPYKANENFPLASGEKLSFVCNESEKAIYYTKQAHGNIEVNFIDSEIVSDLEVGVYNAQKSKLDPTKAYIGRYIQENPAHVFEYQVYGTLPYCDAIPTLSVDEGNQVAFKIKDSRISSKSELNSEHPCSIVSAKSEGHTDSEEVPLSDIENDGTITVVRNITDKTGYVTVVFRIDDNPANNYNYVVYFDNAKFAEQGEIIPDYEEIDIDDIATLILNNKGEKTISFIPYKENFPVEIAKENSIEIETITPEEAMYYLLQANEHLEVKLK